MIEIVLGAGYEASFVLPWWPTLPVWQCWHRLGSVMSAASSRSPFLFLRWSSCGMGMQRLKFGDCYEVEDS